MGVLKRIAYILFSIPSLIAAGLLAYLVFKPFGDAEYVQSQVFNNQPLLITFYVFLGILGIGLLVFLLVALFAPRTSSGLVTSTGSGEVKISRAALESTVRHAVTTYDGVICDSATVFVNKGDIPSMDVDVVLDAGDRNGLSSFGAEIQSAVKKSLEDFTGSPVNRVEVSFLDVSERSRAVEA